MTAIATPSFKKAIIENLITDLADSGETYYLAIGKSDAWDENETVPTTVNTREEERKFRSNMQSIKKISDGTFAATRYNWSSGTVYKAYNDAVTLASLGAYYVFTESQRVYICIEQGKDDAGVTQISSVNPDTIGTGTAPVRTADNYVWKYLFSITSVNTNKFLSANFIPVSLILTAGNLIETEQLNVQNSAAAGSIIGYRVVTPGTDYPDSCQQVSVVGNGTGAGVTIKTLNGAVVKATIEDSTDGSLKIGSGYNFADVVIGDSNNGAAVIKPIVSIKGLGADPREDINANHIMFNSQPSGSESGDFLVGTGADFRQVGILRNPKNFNDSDFTETTGSTLRKLQLNPVSVTGTFPVDAVIRGQSSNAAAYVDKYDAVNNIIYFHQNEGTGFTQFSNGEAIVDSDNSASNQANLSSVDSDGEANAFSGDVLYIENKSPVSRDAAQTEDIKIIFKL